MPVVMMSLTILRMLIIGIGGIIVLIKVVRITKAREFFKILLWCEEIIMEGGEKDE